MSHRKRYKGSAKVVRRREDLAHVIAGVMVGISHMLFVASVCQTFDVRFPF